jgi:hypothetical protein
MLYALRDLISRRQLGGQPIRPELIALHHHLLTSVDGNETTAPSGQLTLDEELIDTYEAAEILRCSTRRVTQIHTDLDGVKIGRTWVFRRQTVADYAEAKGDGRGDRHAATGRGGLSTRTA